MLVTVSSLQCIYFMTRPVASVISIFQTIVHIICQTISFIYVTLLLAVIICLDFSRLGMVFVFHHKLFGVIVLLLVLFLFIVVYDVVDN